MEGVEVEVVEDVKVEAVVADASSSAVVLFCASEAADADAPAADAAASAALIGLGFDDVVQDEENERGECRCCDDRGGDGSDVEINGARVAVAPPRKEEDSVLACIPLAREKRQRRLRSCCCLARNATSSRIDASGKKKKKTDASEKN